MDSQIPIAFSSEYLYTLPEGHRFPIEKYELVHEQLLHQGIFASHNFYHPGLASWDHIALAHDESYLHKLKTLSLDGREMRKIGLPISEKSIFRARNSVAGTLEGVKKALSGGIAFNLAGGTHHAYADHGEGFCLLNDLAIAARYARYELDIKKILIIDLDVHQGNGSASILRDDADIFTFSIHGKDNYPLKKEKSDLDIALATGTQGDQYLQILEEHLSALIQSINPQFIFFQAGVDVLATDKLGKLSLSKEDCKIRDRMVLQSAKVHHIPLVVTMGGGYSERLADIVDAHAHTFMEAAKLW